MFCSRAIQFMADMWTTAPDGLKSHDLQYWAPLQFDDSQDPPSIQPLTWMDGFDIEVVGAEPGAHAPVVSDGLFRTGSALAKIQANQASCSHSGTFEAWLLALIVCVLTALLAGCWACCGGRARCGIAGERGRGPPRELKGLW